MNRFYITLLLFIKNNCQEQLKVIEEKKRKHKSLLGVCIMPLTALCDTIPK